MKLREYQLQTESTDQVGRKVPRRESVYYLGVLGEMGSLLSEIKKSIRDGDSYTEYRENFSEELGDMFWYLARLATINEIDMGACDSSEFDRSAEIDSSLFQLAAEVQALVHGLRKNSADIDSLFTSVLVAAKTVCHSEGLHLSDVLQSNAQKAKDTWRDDVNTPAPRHDDRYPEYEQLPRNLEVEFIEVSRSLSGLASKYESPRASSKNS